MAVSEADKRCNRRRLAIRTMLGLLVAATIAAILACTSSNTTAEPSPLPPVSELATLEELLGNASPALRNCLTVTFSESELEARLREYVRQPLTSQPFLECDESGIEVFAVAGSVVSGNLPEARAPFGIGTVGFPGETEGIRGLYDRADIEGKGDIQSDRGQVEVLFAAGEVNAANTSATFSGLPETATSDVMIGMMLMLIGSSLPPDSRVGGVDGDVTWLRFVPPQNPDQHALLWASSDSDWTFSVVAGSEQELEQAVQALVSAARNS